MRNQTIIRATDSLEISPCLCASVAKYSSGKKGNTMNISEEDEKLLALPDQAPENDPAWVEQAIETIQNQFAFVGRQENLDEHVSILGERLGWDQNMKVPKMNLGSKKFNVEIDENLRQLIEHHNQLDRKLYEYIINQPNGYWINELLLKKF